jgi:hypothetical protein
VRKRDADGPPGHAWLTIDDTPVHDTPEALADLVPILVFDGQGRREQASGVSPANGEGG